MFLSDTGTEKFRQKKQHHSDGYLADILAKNNLPAILHHEGNHAAQISKQQGMFSRMFNMSPNKPVLTDKHLDPSDFNKGHMDRLVEQRQAAQSFNRANYALAQLLQNTDLTHPDFKQFDKNKLMYVRDKFKELPKSRQEFIQRMQWYGQNPEIALLLGESARGVAYRKEKEDVASNGTTELGDGAKQEASDSIKQFDDGWFLAKHQSNKKTNNA